MIDDRHVLSTSEIRNEKPSREVFRNTARLPIHLVLDGVRRQYNIGAIIRLCDAMLIGKLSICGVNIELRNRKLVQAAQGAQKWVPIENPPSALDVVHDYKKKGFKIVVAEITSHSVTPESFKAVVPLCVVVGNEQFGVSKEILDLADIALSIPMLGFSNSLNVSTATAIILYHLSRQLRQ